MRASTLLSSLYAVGLVSAGCYTSGDSWGGDRSAALAAAQTLCGDGTLSGTYTRNQFKYACRNLSTEKKVDFRIAADNLILLLGDSISMSADQCTTYLEREINGCGQGGSSTYEFPNAGHFTFTSDPNAGNCA